MPACEAVKTQAARRQFLKSSVDVNGKKLMTFLRGMHSTADIAAFHRLHLLLVVGQSITVRWRDWIFTHCNCCHRRRSTFHSFVTLNDSPCLNHVDKIVEREWDALRC